MTWIPPADYEERVYAAVLGKMIGVYLGRPFEGWTNEHIERELGEINYYVHERLGKPLIVTDDDLSGTFTFVRALAENDYDPNLTASQIGDLWLNTIIENRTILWWGGIAMSTEHTAYLRLKAGLKAPESGSIATNGNIVAEQIGAQIFIDGWGLICPGDPERAAHFAGLAATVSHDGEAKYAAQVIAAMEAQAFIESDLNKLLDIALALIPSDSVIFKLTSDVRGWAAESGEDWRATFRHIQAHYGYDKFGGNCHVVPNYAVILLGLLHGGDDFQRALMITNTAGWDTDCNSGNVGCLLGVKNGLATINAGPDWRGPVADRLFLPTADGGRCITDAVRETYALVDTAYALHGLPPKQPKNGARFHFSLPGAVQGFVTEDTPGVREAAAVGHSDGKLLLSLDRVTAGCPARVATATFTSPEALTMPGYGLFASPTLYPGQTVHAALEAKPNLSDPVRVGLYIRVYGPDNALVLHRGPVRTLGPGQTITLDYRVPDSGGEPVAEVGVEISAETRTQGEVLVDHLTWEGTPAITLGRPQSGSTVWESAWVNAATHFHGRWSSPPWLYRVIQDDGTGLVTQGEYEWTDYTVSVDVLPHLADRIGLLGAVRGLRRYVALVLDTDRRIRLIEQRDDTRRVLAESESVWQLENPVSLSLTLTKSGITAQAGDATLTAQGEHLPSRGAIGLMVDTGYAEFGAVQVQPA